MMGSPVDFRELLRACESADLDAGRGLGAAARRGRRRAPAHGRGEQFGKLVLTT